ncbi:LON peptidase substrate-binding domain-containing protein [soil metagenome]
MTNFIPIFPLSLVVYPQEELNLHVFEPRYIQLIKECYETKIFFGIPTVMENSVKDLGTLMEIIEMSKVYDNGEMDIKTRGIDVFKILEVIRDVPDKLYNGAIVTYPKNSFAGSRKLMQKVIESIAELHKLLNIEKKFKKPLPDLQSYDVAHHAGLTLEEEYELLGLMDELQREEYLKRHLSRVIPVVAEMETLKEKAQMNGHFRNLKGFKL